MTVIVLMLVQICCNYIPTSNVTAIRRGCPSSCCFFPFFCIESQMSLSFYPCNAVGILDLQSFLVFLLNGKKLGSKLFGL